MESGPGFPPIVDAEFARFGESPKGRERADRLDEGLDILAGLWSGEPFSYAGRHYCVDAATFLPRPIQLPRIPIWVAATWPGKPPFRRAARWDGVCLPEGDGSLTPADVRTAVSYIQQHREFAEPFDVSWAGTTPADDLAAGAAKLAPYVEAGLTWWVESVGPRRGGVEDAIHRIRRGPPDASYG